MRAIVLLALALAVAGCGASANPDKSGGEAAPVTLRMATMESDAAPYADGVREFARQVDDLSDGSLASMSSGTARSTYFGEFGVGADQEVAGLVQSGKLDMALIPARSWDRLGVTSLQALQAPFLVDNEALVDAVVTSDVAQDMLAGLDKAGVVGIALLPEGLRYPVGFDGRMTAGDFAGATLRVAPSDASFRLFEALGAEPVDLAPDDFDSCRSGSARSRARSPSSCAAASCRGRARSPPTSACSPRRARSSRTRTPSGTYRATSGTSCARRPPGRSGS